MHAYLIECGHQTILFIKELRSYTFIDASYLTLFAADNPDFSCLDKGKHFNYSLNQSEYTDNTTTPATHCTINQDNEAALLQRFLDPQLNAGAIIALRDSDQPQPQIFDKRRYQRLLHNL